MSQIVPVTQLTREAAHDAHALALAHGDPDLIALTGLVAELSVLANNGEAAGLLLKRAGVTQAEWESMRRVRDDLQAPRRRVLDRAHERRRTGRERIAS